MHTNICIGKQLPKSQWKCYILHDLKTYSTYHKHTIHLHKYSWPEGTQNTFLMFCISKRIIKNVVLTKYAWNFIRCTIEMHGQIKCKCAPWMQMHTSKCKVHFGGWFLKGERIFWIKPSVNMSTWSTVSVLRKYLKEELQKTIQDTLCMCDCKIPFSTQWTHLKAQDWELQKHPENSPSLKVGQSFIRSVSEQINRLVLFHL